LFAGRSGRVASCTSRSGTPASSAAIDERGAEHVRVDGSDAGSSADRTHPPVRSAAVESGAVAPRSPLPTAP
jgi:hypothetical protein